MLNPESTRRLFYINARVNKALYNSAVALGPHFKFEMPNYDAPLKAGIFNAICLRQLQN